MLIGVPVYIAVFFSHSLSNYDLSYKSYKMVDNKVKHPSLDMYTEKKYIYNS